MAQYIFTMNGLGKVVPPKKEILKDINLNFFPGAKIGVLGYNGAGKSTLLRIMAGVDTDFIGEARPASGIRIGYLPQEPDLDPNKDVRGNVEDGLSDIKQAHEQLEAVYAAYAEPDADFAASSKSLQTRCACRHGRPMSRTCPVVSAVELRCVDCCCHHPTCSYLTNQPIISMPSPLPGWSASSRIIREQLWQSPMTATFSIMLPT